MDISVLIVNYNGAKFIQECLDSLFKSKTTASFEVIVVDNASIDNSLEILDSYKNKITLISNKENTGFSYANNQAGKIAKGKNLYLLNNDTLTKEDTLDILYKFLSSHTDAGVITPKLLNADGSLQCPGSIFGHWRFWSKTARKVPFIAGAAVLFPTAVYWEMGGLDENLFFYNDDVDMCKTLKRLGYGIYYVPEAALIHFGGLSTKYRKSGSLIEGYRGGVYLSLKHYGFIVSLIYRFFTSIEICINLLIHLLLSFSQSHRDSLKTYLEILRIVVFNDIYLERIKKKMKEESK
jgi:GT2 family glycosyltransferase